jgi:hypothetical protein
VSATNHILPHISSRREVLGFPSLELIDDAGEKISVDYAIADLRQLQQYQVAFDDDRQRLRTMVPLINQLLNRGSYGIIGCQDGVILMRRGVVSDAVSLAAWSAFRQEVEPILE